MSGWIKLHRCILDKAIFDNEKLLKVFIWCLYKATHAEHEQLVGRTKVLLQPGQFITGRKKASEELNMKPSTAWDYIKLLESNNSINIKSNNKYSIISIDNWALYQSEEENSDNRHNNKSNIKATTNEHQIDTNKNDKNDKNVKNIYIVPTEQLWSLYPNKTGKATAIKKIPKLIKQYSYEQIERCIERYKQYVTNKQNTDFPTLKYQNGSTFFTSGYMDYLDENYKPLEATGTEQNNIWKPKVWR